MLCAVWCAHTNVLDELLLQPEHCAAVKAAAIACPTVTCCKTEGIARLFPQYVRCLDQTSYGRGADLWNSPWNAGNQGIGKSLSSRIMHRGTQHREENAPN